MPLVVRIQVRFFLRCVVIVATIACCGSQIVRAADEEDEEDLGRPGLVVSYEPMDATAAIDDRPAFSLGPNESPAPRVPADRFSIHWKGRLQVLRPGKY